MNASQLFRQTFLKAVLSLFKAVLRMLKAVLRMLIDVLRFVPLLLTFLLHAHNSHFPFWPKSEKRCFA